jgi:2-polyprenyl-6-methoxyphenol hydroxylase-like FAD-dependent oxidoreductase
MPPGGESVGLALEDSVILTRIISSFDATSTSTNSNTNTSATEVFEKYNAVRRPRIEAQYAHSTGNWEGVKDHWNWVQWIREALTKAYVGWLGARLEESFAYDALTVEI